MHGDRAKEAKRHGGTTNGLFAHADKCEFHTTSCKYLGYMLSPAVSVTDGTGPLTLAQ